MQCPMCHHNQFTIIDGYITEHLQDDYRSIVIGSGKTIPSIILVCSQCGFMIQHSLGVLGILNNEGEINSRVIAFIPKLKKHFKAWKGHQNCSSRNRLCRSKYSNPTQPTSPCNRGRCNTRKSITDK